MTDESVVEQGSPWTAVRYFSNFSEADTLRTSLKSSDLSGVLQIKVKRCGVGGNMYVVKTRQSAEMKAAVAAVDEAVASKPAKKTRKTKT